MNIVLVLVVVLDWAHFLGVFSKDRRLRSPQTRIGLSDQYLSTLPFEDEDEDDDEDE